MLAAGLACCAAGERLGEWPHGDVEGESTVSVPAKRCTAASHKNAVSTRRNGGDGGATCVMPPGSSCMLLLAVLETRVMTPTDGCMWKNVGRSPLLYRRSEK